MFIKEGEKSGAEDDESRANDVKGVWIEKDCFTVYIGPWKHLIDLEKMSIVEDRSKVDSEYEEMQKLKDKIRTAAEEVQNERSRAVPDPEIIYRGNELELIDVSERSSKALLVNIDNPEVEQIQIVNKVQVDL